MFKKSLPLLIAGLVTLSHATSAKAQYLDMSQMVQNELNFQQQFNQWAWKGSLEAARQLRLSGQQNPFDAMTISRSLTEGQQAFTGYIRHGQAASQRTSDAIGRWTDGAIRGVGPYQDPSTGRTYNLPWTHNQYHINQWGQMVPGYNPHRTNVYPYYGR